MLLDDDVVTDGEAKARALAGRLCREERSEQPLLHIGPNASAIVANRDLDAVAEALGRRSKGRLIVAATCFCFALGRRVKAV
jgi:hypothetical protein